MTCCEQPLTITWTEPSLLVYPPNWWDTEQLGPFQPPAPQQSHHQLCLHCGDHPITFDIGDPLHEMAETSTDDAMHLEGQ